MRKNYIIIAFFASIAIVACNSDKPKQDNVEVSITKGKPNKDSEMTLLMREMFANYEAVKDSIVNGNNINRDLFNEVHRIHRVAPSDSAIMGVVFNNYANVYLETVDAMLLAEADKETYFNLSVQACLNCHQELCPGPTDKIKKLLILPKEE